MASKGVVMVSNDMEGERKGVEGEWRGVEGGWMGIPQARIRDRIWPTQESASVSRRFAFSACSAYMIASNNAADSLLLASVESVASLSRRSLAFVRIWFTVAACSGTLRDEIVIPEGFIVCK